MGVLLKCFYISVLIATVCGQQYEDMRCICICPSLPALLNSTNANRIVYRANVPANKCNCAGVIMPQISAEFKGREQELCPRCECKYETRNTTIIMVVVILLIWVMMSLASYMGFLICLDPLINKRRVRFHQERGTEEMCGSPPPLTNPMRAWHARQDF